MNTVQVCILNVYFFLSSYLFKIAKFAEHKSRLSHRFYFFFTTAIAFQKSIVVVNERFIVNGSKPCILLEGNPFILILILIQNKAIDC